MNAETRKDEEMHSIRGRIIAITAAAVTASILAFMTIAYFTLGDEAARNTAERMNMMCRNVQLSLDEYLTSIRQSVEMAAHFATDALDPVVLVECGAAGSNAGKERTRAQVRKLDMYLAEHSDQVQEAFASVASHTSGVVTYYYCIAPEISGNEHGFFYSKIRQAGFSKQPPLVAQELDPADLEHTTWYYTPIRRGRPSWVGPYLAHFLDEEWTVSYLAPVYRANALIGVMGMDILLDTMREKVDAVRVADSGYACLFDADGTILAHPDYEIGTKPDGEMQAVFEQLRGRADSGDGVIRYSADGEERQMAFSTLSNGLKLAVVAPTREISASWDTLTRRILLAALVILAAVILLTVLLVRRLTRPLRQLSEAAAKLASGDYDVALSYDEDNEVGQLTRSFREMRDHLKLYISDLNSKAYTDALTRVKNKAAFDILAGRMDQAIRMSKKQDQAEFAIAMFDCNELKEINDAYGHEYGDLYLQGACRTICNVFAHSPVFRLGGDEFAALLKQEDYENRTSLLEEFDQAVKAHNRKAEKPWEKVSLARGLATFRPGVDTSVEEVLRRADQRMYRDKRLHKEEAGLDRADNG